jgi:uncharacterized protein with PhoU and TrkA domain
LGDRRVRIERVKPQAFEVRPPRSFVGRTLREVDLSGRLQLTPIALRRGTNVIVNPHRDERIAESDELVLIGRDDHLEQLRD